MAQKTPIELLREIVGAYKALGNVEADFGNRRPDLLDVARSGLSDRIDEAEAMLKNPPGEDPPFVSSPNKLRGTQHRR